MPTIPAPTPKPPRHLKAPTKRWWRSVVNEWVLSEHHIILLTKTCEALDRNAQAREAIAKDGLTTRTADGGVKMHPAVRVEAETRIAVARLLRELDLDVEPPAAEKRPPALRSVR